MLCLLCFSGAASHLGNQEIHPEWCVLVLQEALEFRDLLSEHIRCVSNAADDTKTAGICYRCCEFGASGNVHASEEDGVVDFEEVGDRGAELFCG